MQCDVKNASKFILPSGSTMNPHESGEILRGAEVVIISQEKCKKQYEHTFSPIKSSMICAGHPKGGKDSCQGEWLDIFLVDTQNNLSHFDEFEGDSGGPLICENRENEEEIEELYGVVSWGRGCGLPNYAGVYGRVQSARRWIYSVTGIWKLK